MGTFHPLLAPTGPLSGRPASSEPASADSLWTRLRRDRVGLVALGACAGLVALSAAAPVVVHLLGRPGYAVLDKSALDPYFGTATGPSAHHWLGVDLLGEDVFSRTLYGLQLSVLVGLGSTAVCVAVGTTVGLLAGYARGPIDLVLSRGVEVVLAFPVLLLGLGLASACSLGRGCAGGLIRPGVSTVVLVIAAVNWTGLARLVRARARELGEAEFVLAARALGASHPRIVLHHVLPNLLGPVVVYAALLVPQCILLEAALSFLGVGVTPPRPSLGQMLADAAPGFQHHWWYMTFPGLALLALVVALNVLGDRVRAALAPRGA